MTDTTPTSPMKYRYRLPAQMDHFTTQSFGIEPYYFNIWGRKVKAGKAIIRCVIYNGLRSSRQRAEEAATRIVELLNEGREYKGPKVLHFDQPRFVEGYFND